MHPILHNFLLLFGYCLAGSIMMAIALGIMIKILNWLTPIDEWEELKKGNVAVAIVVAAVVLAFATSLGIRISHEKGVVWVDYSELKVPHVWTFGFNEAEYNAAKTGASGAVVPTTVTPSRPTRLYELTAAILRWIGPHRHDLRFEPTSQIRWRFARVQWHRHPKHERPHCDRFRRDKHG